MEAYRVYTQNGSVEFRKLEQAQAYHSEFGISDIESFEIKEEPWDKAAYSQECSAAHSEWYRQIYTRKPDLDYESKDEIVMYLSIEDEELRAQATNLTNLWFQSVDMLYAHIAEVTEATANAEAFIQTLPEFTT